MGVENKLNYIVNSKISAWDLQGKKERERERVKRIKIAPADHVWFHVGDNKQVQCDVGPTKDI